VTSSSATTLRYFAIPSNSAGTGPLAQLDVEWQNSAAYGGFCGQYARIKTFNVPWGDSNRYATRDYGNFTSETVFVMVVQVPSSPSSYPSEGYTSIAEFAGPPGLREMSLSKAPCDFRAPDPTGANGPIAGASGVAATIHWNVGAQPLVLTPGATYYFNFRNFNCADTCDAGIVSVFPH
jgi:hypothetical protein